jgi:hypothetical protein
MLRGGDLDAVCLPHTHLYLVLRNLAMGSLTNVVSLGGKSWERFGWRKNVRRGEVGINYILGQFCGWRLVKFHKQTKWHSWLTL